MIPIQFRDFGNEILLLFSFLIPLLYVFFIKPYVEKKKTPFISIEWTKVLLTTFSHIILFFSPLLLFLFNPAFSFEEYFLIFFRIVYFFFFGFVIVLVGIDIIRYGYQYVFYLAGMDGLIEKNKIREVVKELGLKRRRK